MATPWKDVIQNPQYQALPPDQQEAARQQYFNQVVAPQLPDDSSVATAKQQFDNQYGPRNTPFDAAVQNEVAKARAQDAQGPSLGQRAGDAVIDFANAEKHHLGNMATGIGQLVGHGITSAANAILPADSSLRQQINATNTNADQAIAQREQNYQANVPNSPAAYAGATAGEIAPWLLEAPAKGVQTIGNIASKIVPEAFPVLRRIVSGVAQGGAVAATQPVTSGPQGSQLASLVSGQPTAPSFATQKSEQVGLGGLVGGVVPAVGNVVGNIYQLGRHIFNPTSVAAQNIAEKLGSSPQVLQQLDTAQSGVPGVQMTSAQAAPSAGAVGAEKAMGNTAAFKEQLTQRQTQNNQARIDAIQQLAGDDATYAAAKAARDNAPLPNGQTISQYQKSLPSKTVDPSAILKTIDSIKNSGLGARPTISKALDDIKSAISSRVDANGQLPADILDSIRQNTNDFLVSPTGKQASAQEKAGVQPIKAKIIDTLDSASPGYRDYLAAFADKSTPLNTMDAARSILDRADNHPLNSAGASPLSLNDINRGLAQIEKGRYGVSPQAQQTLDAIQESLKREGISNSIRSPGSDTTYNINAQGALPSAILGPNLGGATGKTRLGGAALGSLIGQHFGGLEGAAAGAGLGAFINKGADFVNGRIMEQYAKGLLNPQDAATMIRAYLAGNQSQATKLLAKYPQWNALLSSQAGRSANNP